MSEHASSTQAPGSLAPAVAPQTGRFVWFEIVTPRPADSVAFYSALFGWSAETVPMGDLPAYTMFRVGDVPIAGVVPQALTPSPVPAWLSYALVPDVAEACAHAVELGARVLVPDTDIPGIGRFAVIADPSGAALALHSALGEPGPEVPVAPPGTVSWLQLLTKDPAAAIAFYEGLFGWTHEATDLGPLGVYYVFKRGEVNAAGMMPMPPEATSPSFWLPYVAVADVDASARRAEALGGRLHVPPSDIPGVGRYAVASDDVGATIALFRPAR